MKLNDALIGALLGVFAIAVLLYVRGFPPMPGQQFGPALFPGLVAAGLLICGVALIRRGLKSGGPAIELAPWTRSTPHLGNFALIVLALVFYILAADTLGFVPTGFILLAVLFLKLRVKPVLAIVTALIATLVIHALFYKLLRVPLPWGVLRSVAW